jgi:cation diffusion facilitator family transporter
MPATAEELARGRRAALVATASGTLLAAIKIGAGLVGNSYALVADGIESLLDIFSSLVVWGGLRIAARPPDASHPYGHGKAEALAALAVSLTLLLAGLGLAVQSVREIVTPHHAPAPFTLAVLAGVVVIKESLFAWVGRIGRSLSSTALEAEAWHHRSDALTSAAAFVGICLALLGGPGWESLDDWAALFACCVIGYNGVRLARTAVADVMDAAAPAALERGIRDTARGVGGVVDVDKCFARKSGSGWLVDLHVVVDGRLPVSEGHRIGHDVQHALRASKLGILDVLVHVEPG